MQDMYYRISQAVDDRDFAIGIFVDLSKAFDTINHNILLHKLEYYGVCGITLQWFKDYLSKRKHCLLQQCLVKFNECYLWGTARVNTMSFIIYYIC